MIPASVYPDGIVVDCRNPLSGTQASEKFVIQAI
jgi:hypothetical protein